MIGIAILLSIAIGIWVSSLFFVLDVILDEDKSYSKIGLCFAILIVFGAIGFTCAIPSLVTITKHKTITYETPTVLIKTNNLTIVQHIQDSQCVIQLTSDSTSYWNSTNIMVKKTSGENLFGVSVRPDYEVVDTKNK